MDQESPLLFKSRMATTPKLPVAISLINDRYLLFSINVVSYLRREHHICGVLIGGLPQIPQQNVFLGLPLELMPEEARLLVEAGIAYVIDDVRSHDEGIRRLEPEMRQQYLACINTEGGKASRVQTGRREQNREKALKKLASGTKETHTEPNTTPPSMQASDGILPPRSQNSAQDEGSLFVPTENARRVSAKLMEVVTLGVTPATSSPLLPETPGVPPAHYPGAPASYPLFAHLHAKGYFLSPGLRFGCQYLVYPGDPLRFHSHFLAVGANWDEEFNLMDIVGGGRLGTGVKKAYLIGGQEPKLSKEDDTTEVTRTFSVEWAGM